VLQSEEKIRGEMFARGWETCPDQTFQYSYGPATSTPMSYPKCEMEFPYQESSVSPGNQRVKYYFTFPITAFVYHDLRCRLAVWKITAFLFQQALKLWKEL